MSTRDGEAEPAPEPAQHEPTSQPQLRTSLELRSKPLKTDDEARSGPFSASRGRRSPASPSVSPLGNVPVQDWQDLKCRRESASLQPPPLSPLGLATELGTTRRPRSDTVASTDSSRTTGSTSRASTIRSRASTQQTSHTELAHFSDCYSGGGTSGRGTTGNKLMDPNAISILSAAAGSQFGPVVPTDLARRSLAKSELMDQVSSPLDVPLELSAINDEIERAAASQDTRRTKTVHFNPEPVYVQHHNTFPVNKRFKSGAEASGSRQTQPIHQVPVTTASKTQPRSLAPHGLAIRSHGSSKPHLGLPEARMDDTGPGIKREGVESRNPSNLAPDAVDPSTPERASADTASPSLGGRYPRQRLTPTSSGSDTDSDRDDDGDDDAPDELDDEGRDRFVKRIYSVMLQHTPNSALDDLEEPLKGLAVWCVERASNMAQESLNKLSSQLGFDELVSDAGGEAEAPCDGPFSSHSGTSDAGAAGQGSPNPLKRQGSSKERSDGGSDGNGREGGGNGGGFDGGNGDAGGGRGSKRHKKDESEHPHKPRMSCPFRKRNPLRFNVRVHDNCALQPFQDIFAVKRHVKECHKKDAPKNECPRCRRGFATQIEMIQHLRKVEMCERLPEPPHSANDPEDGVSPDVYDKLCGRSKEHKVDNWKILWQTLFGKEDAVKGCEYIPPVELFEVEAEFARDTSSLSLRQKLEPALGHLVPRVLEAAVQKCQEYISETLDACRAIPQPKKDASSAHADAPRTGSASDVGPVIGCSSTSAPSAAATGQSHQATASPQGHGLPTPDMTPVIFSPYSSFQFPPQQQQHQQQQWRSGRCLGPPNGHTSPPTPTRPNNGHRRIAPKHPTSSLTAGPRERAAAKAARSQLNRTPTAPAAPMPPASMPIVALPTATMAARLTLCTRDTSQWSSDSVAGGHYMSPAAIEKQPADTIFRTADAGGGTAGYSPIASPSIFLPPDPDPVRTAGGEADSNNNTGHVPDGNSVPRLPLHNGTVLFEMGSTTPHAANVAPYVMGMYPSAQFGLPQLVNGSGGGSGAMASASDPPAADAFGFDYFPGTSMPFDHMPGAPVDSFNNPHVPGGDWPDGGAPEMS